MANVKINDLALIADPASTDVLPVVDVTADTTNKISIADILKTAPEGTASAPAIAFEGDSNTGIYHPGSEQIAFSTSGVGRVFIASDGKVGIGTSDPEGQLTVQQSAVTNAPSRISALYLENNANCEIQMVGNPVNDCQVRFGTGSNSFKGALEYQLDVDALLVYTNSSERLRINSSGNVGIGTSSPAYDLQVSRNNDASVSIKAEGDTSGPRANRLIYSFSDGDGASINAIRATSDTAADVNLSFRTGGITNSEERLRIDSSGNVGIGKTNPAKLLDVNGDALINDLNVGRGAGNYSSNTAVGNNSFISNTTGTFNIAIGQNSLNANTEGTGNTGVGQGTLVDNTTGSNNVAIGQVSLNSNTEGDANTAVGRQALNSNITGSLNTAVGRNAGRYIEGSNNTIIGAYQGTTADATLNNTVIISAGPTERLRIDSSGNVGIGETSPAKLLDVNGDALINGVTVGRGASNVDTNTAVGFAALNANTTGDENTAVGRGALSSNTEGSDSTALGRSALGSNTTGELNNAFGRLALFSNTEGSFNTAVGRNALFSNTVGSLNTGIGNNAGFYIQGSSNTVIGAYQGTTADATLNNTVIIAAGATERLRIDSSGNVGIGRTNPDKLLDVNGDARINSLNIGRGGGNGSSNTAFGVNALNANTTGIYNTAVGSNTLPVNTEGDANTAVGQGSLISNTTGSDNTALGRQALNSNTTGTENTAVGGIALNSNTTGVNNTAVGRQALRNNTEGNSNTALGQASLSNNITGTNNTAIGRTAGFYIEGSNNTILGAYQGTSADATLNSTVIISAGATERLRIDSSGNVGVGTNAPVEKLDISNGILRVSNNATPSNENDNAAYFGKIGGNAIVSHSSTVAFRVNSTERARIDASGRLLVGTSSARVVGFGVAPNVQVEGVNNVSAGSLALTQNRSADALGSRLVLTKTRGSALGATTIVQNDDEFGSIYFCGADGTNADVRGALIQAFVDGTPGTNDMPGRLTFSTTADGASIPTERMRISSGGVVTINWTGAPPSSEKFYVNNVVSGFNRESDGQTVRLYRSGAQVGSISVTTSATAYNTSSDYRLKENVVPLANAADRLNQLQVHRFNFIADPDTVVDGFLAHEVQTIVPEAITGEKDAVDDEGNPEYQGIDQSKMVPLVVAALQEAIAKIEVLEQRLTDAGL